MLWAASDMEVWERGSNLVVRIVNKTGHKLPTGYIEGRRAWINVAFQDAGGQTIAEHGAYDTGTADLVTSDTKVYESHHGLSAAVAALSGLPIGPGFHFALNNVIEDDNRIPPRGFKNSEFLAVQAQPAGATYLDEQYWDETEYAIPVGATRAVVLFNHQTTSKEYITFLRDHTDDLTGQVAYDLWVQEGKSAPIGMDRALVQLDGSSCPTPIPYGLAKQTSGGKVPRLSGGSVPSQAAGMFTLHLEDAVPNSFGVVIRSTTTASVPFQGGKRLVGPFQRVRGFMTDANGTANVSVATGPAGSVSTYQLVFRDLGDPTGYGLSDGLWVEFCD